MSDLYNNFGLFARKGERVRLYFLDGMWYLQNIRREVQAGGDMDVLMGFLCNGTLMAIPWES